ncbi:orotidine 5'-phosphate decarboxylase [Bacillus licheniformis]|nr:orotidine 5'-phosphate decarboxylase [Bacillus licheniformis]
MELFIRKDLPSLKSAGARLPHFLDLKCHDIPTTVYKAMKRLAGFGVSLVNVHAAGGKQMMESALEGLEAGTPAGQNALH